MDCDQQQRLIINVSGHHFTTTRQTLLRHPDTKLGRLASDERALTPGYEVFFDADEDVFREVLRYYRTGELHAPTTMCYQTFVRQLGFWEVSAGSVEECCQPEKEEEVMERQFQWFERCQDILPKDTPCSQISLRTKIWICITSLSTNHHELARFAKTWALVYTFAAVAQSITLGLMTMPDVVRQTVGMDSLFQMLNYSFTADGHCWNARIQMHVVPAMPQWRANMAFMVFFFIEMLFRVICCPNKKYFVTSSHMIDAVAVLLEVWYALLALAAWQLDYSSSGLCTLLTGSMVVVFITVNLRAVRIVTIIIHWRRMKVLMLTIYSSAKEVMLLLMVLGISCLIAGPAVFYCDTLGGILLQADNPPNLNSIPIVYWWVLVTMTTVGYGDYYPSNVFGYAAASLVIVLGLIMTALPVAVIGSHFAMYNEYSLKRKRRANRAREERHTAKAEPASTPCDPAGLT